MKNFNNITDKTKSSADKDYRNIIHNIRDYNDKVCALGQLCGLLIMYRQVLCPNSTPDLVYPIAGFLTFMICSIPPFIDGLRIEFFLQDPKSSTFMGWRSALVTLLAIYAVILTPVFAEGNKEAAFTALVIVSSMTAALAVGGVIVIASEIAKKIREKKYLQKEEKRRQDILSQIRKQNMINTK